MTKIQVALDVTELKTAKKIARQAVKGGADWIEAGTPLIKTTGLQAVQELKKQHPDKKIIADMKTMDTGSLETEIASKKNADIISILGTAADTTIKEAIKKSREYGTEIMTDLINTENPVKRAIELEEMGADIILVHTGIDQQHAGSSPLDTLHRLKNQVNTEIAVAGGLNEQTAPKASESADIIVIGGAITRSKNPEKATRQIKKKVEKRKQKTNQEKTEEKPPKEKAMEISTCNIADAQNNKGYIPNLIQINGEKTFGKTLTVKTIDGDWSKPVQAIDKAEPGDILVIDASGGEKAVWGELATKSAIQKKLAGVIINGAVRDTEEIRKLELPVWALKTTAMAGEPKGYGEIGAKVTIQQTEVETGDYIHADQNGAIVIKQKDLNHTINKARMIKQNEDRIRSQIKEGTTLSKAIELENWEQE
ncbi:3-hexulose-6-phosphate synthase [Methanonatronarchaeum sp. AMET6-2]|uniref:3-hexulose-6-phosphate synthase n=1 Tax=Methanonatronarchaeum sp. AMET6-2 TaxID=2933293 RepID=UPI00121C4F03|nr:3-hexulose-6-phosphate synthase [Methanonatronarchaeum sp. AMET6-2]RZN60723.1 MAG: bifunctional hexulose-6-phosphate synthase/ribonuclease regulator [Methanonatronarchaeia archaeon]UOY09882.1 orotidine 5'-phosphate decarboxylase [Methanonatronarchaeum sp. AMET6-2]